MRSLQRNYRKLYYSVPISTEPILDDYGNDTLEVRTLYGEPVLLQINVSANVGTDEVNSFGSTTEYHRTAYYAGAECPLKEGCHVWFDVEPDKHHNYIVVKVADSKNGFLIALREVSDCGEDNSGESDKPEFDTGDNGSTEV